MSVFIMCAFVELREALATHKDHAKRIHELESRLERKLATRDQAITRILEAIRQLMVPPEPAKNRRIGFVQTDWMVESRMKRELENLFCNSPSVIRPIY